MKLCPKKFGEDMTKPENLAYCQQIKEENTCKGCPYYSKLNKETKSVELTKKQKSLF